MAFLPPSPQQPPRPPGPPDAGHHHGAAPPGRLAGPPPVPLAGPPAIRPPTVLGLRARQWMLVAAVVGCCYLAMTVIGAAGAWTTLHRDPTNAELQRAANAEVARRWEAWPADRVFPARLSYAPDEGRSEYATRMGIVPDTGCEQGVDPGLMTTLRKHGCKAVLRATYTDQLEGVVVTVGVAVFPDPWQADRAFKELPDSHGPDGTGTVAPALKAAAFPGTAAARFTDAARQDRTFDRGGPYVVLTTSGQTDGRPAAAVKKPRPGEPFIVAPQLGRAVARSLSVRSLPDCDRSEWRC
ncbi:MULTISPECIES: hypothetical protein [Actinomadura]|uniref:Uncharacterized protein n=1 Tax=Actinomadura litoris TaxID=2678616 RepID=A0A7K1L5N6_9ACTN|nr:MULTISPECIES: hypothetical protein [Actinomadura]MBT2208507.1 hypothetical protein [Actinomadura sp. NEAU-AAG7]MUN39737.1 hypothetical protein [Actinomadura litoris]